MVKGLEYDDPMEGHMEESDTLRELCLIEKQYQVDILAQCGKLFLQKALHCAGFYHLSRIVDSALFHDLEQFAPGQ